MKRDSGCVVIIIFVISFGALLDLGTGVLLSSGLEFGTLPRGPESDGFSGLFWPFLSAISNFLYTSEVGGGWRPHRLHMSCYQSVLRNISRQMNCFGQQKLAVLLF